MSSAAPMFIAPSLTLAAFFQLLDVWVETINARLEAVESRVKVHRWIPGATSYSAPLPPVEPGREREFDADSEQWFEEWEAPWFHVDEKAREEQHRLLQAKGLLRTIRESTEAHAEALLSMRDNENKPYWPSAGVLASSLRDVREALAAVSVDPTSPTPMTAPKTRVYL